ncbi:hypothetical protein [Tropicibacter sp. S64]|uniref:hypothetical protein n=1 Tax=Tropicibacter sp. S64 TaxID=3415122 RepID=UPI003C7CC0CB
MSMDAMGDSGRGGWQHPHGSHHRMEKGGHGHGRAIGHQARAALGEAGGSGCCRHGRMGEMASALAKVGSVQVDVISVMVNVYAAGVSVTYGGTAEAPEAAPVEAAPAAAETPPAETAPLEDVAEETPFPEDTAVEEEATAEEEAAVAAQAYTVSAWAFSMSLQYTSASVALSLLR